MKPIDKKDLPKVVGLGVVSVGMLGFFAMTLMGAMGKKDNPPPAQPAPAAATGTPALLPGATAAVGTPGQSPLTLVRNDQLVELGGPNEPFRKVLPEPGGADPFPKIRLGGKLPRLNGRLPVTPIQVGSFGSSSSAAIAPAAIVEPAVRLDGVMSDRHPYAVVTCGDRTDMYHVGSRFAGLYEVVGINESGAMFRGPKGIFRLEVGDEHVPAPATPASQPQPQTSPQAEQPRQLQGTLEPLAESTPLLPLPGKG